ncbi:MAG: InlB B-repeat-containing protein [Firmicutes bacterium]|nr:InlB B-repeat-containing protein [Bacillota bacterium]MCL1954172.1 InlB B-repeat-containing protein [Bacillota bacterium]
MSSKNYVTKYINILHIAVLTALLIVSTVFLLACETKNPEPQPTYYTVRFDTMGGTNISTQTVKEGDILGRPFNNPTHPDGYTFVDWYADTGYTIKYDFNSRVTRNFTIYAKWDSDGKDVCMVTLFGNGGQFDNGAFELSQIVPVGGYIVQNTPTKSGSSFDGWYLDNNTFNNSFSFSSPVYTDINLYAKWQQDSGTTQEVTVTFDAQGGSGLSMQSKQVSVGASYATLATLTPPSGKIMVGWYTQQSGGSQVTSSTTVTNTNNHTLYAQYQDNNTGGGGGNNTTDREDTTPDAVEARFKKYLDEQTYNIFFPMRKGVSPWDADGAEDFYSYDKLIEAMRMMANIKIRNIRNSNDLGDIGKIFVTNKSTGVETLAFTSIGFDANSNALFEEVVDYGAFLADGNENTQKRELAAFLANISHESTGGGFSATTREWGLFFNEESGLNDSTVGWYTTDPRNPGEELPHANFPPNPNKSYHGRGPIQLSWNYNYGLFSSILYGDKQVLLDDPNSVKRENNGHLAFASAIWFWMTPQGLKPSCHSVMTGVYVPTAQDIAAGRTTETLGIAWTIVIINGYYEANQSRDYPSVGDRILFYEFFTGNAWHENGKIPGVTTTGIDADISGEKLDTLGMSSYAW